MTQISRGTVAVTNGSQIVTGTGTLFVTDSADNGDLFIVDGENVAYPIASVDTELQVTLASNYAGVTDSGLAYAISVDFTPNFGFPLPQTGDIGVSAQLRDAFTEIDIQLLNTVGVTTLNGLTDTDLTGLNDDDILKYNQISGKWEPASQATGSGMFALSDDPAPVLGGTMSVDGNSIVSTGGGDIIINPDTTGRIIADGNELPGDAGSAGQFLQTNGAGVTSWAIIDFAGVKDGLSGEIQSPRNKTHYLFLNAPFACTIDEITVKTSTGTVTMAVEIEGTAVTGLGSISVTSSKATSTASAANTVAAGDEVTMILSAVNATVDLSFTLEYTRT